MRTALFLIFQLASATFAWCQGDSLLRALESAAPDTQSLQLITRMPLNWSGQSMAERTLRVLRHHMQGLEHSTDPAVRRNVARARLHELFLEGSLLGMRSDFSGAAVRFNQAGRGAAELHDTAALVRFEAHLSNLYRQLGDTVSAVLHGNRGTDLALSIGDSASAHNILHDLARIDRSPARLQQVLALADRKGTEGLIGSQVGSLVTDHSERTARKSFTIIPRGNVQAKGKGELEMYFVDNA